MPLPKRACDACHRRKVRCLGGHPCRNCLQAGLECTFLAIPRKKGPKGSRAKIISELRESQQQTLRDSTLQYDSEGRGSGLDTPPESPRWARKPDLLSPEMLRACIDFFFTHMYPTMPILHRAGLEGRLATIDSSPETYCLVTALCAFMMIQPGMKVAAGNSAGELGGPARPTGMANSIVSGSALLEEALRVRKSYDYVEAPTTATVVTSFFIFGCYFGLDRHNTAWFHLREATTLAQILGMPDESTYLAGNPVETSRRRRLFWILFVTERAYALQRHRPLTLHATIEMPRTDEDPNETVEISGFVHLVNLFRPFNDTFVGLWNKTRADCSTAWLAQLQAQLAAALPSTLDCTESQAADLRTSQHWLRTKIWELSITNGYLSSTSPDSSMTFKYPIEIARDLVGVTSALSQQSMEVHGVGLIEKLFDVACTLTEVMSCIPLGSPSSMVELGPRDYLNQCLNLIATLRGGGSRFLPLLLVKIDETLPSFGAPMTRPLSTKPHDHRVLDVGESSSTDSSAFNSPPAMLSEGGVDLSSMPPAGMFPSQQCFDDYYGYPIKPEAEMDLDLDLDIRDFLRAPS